MICFIGQKYLGILPKSSDWEQRAAVVDEQFVEADDDLDGDAVTIFFFTIFFYDFFLPKYFRCFRSVSFQISIEHSINYKRFELFCFALLSIRTHSVGF